MSQALSSQPTRRFSLLTLLLPLSLVLSISLIVLIARADTGAETVSLTSLGSTITENFDTLGNTGTTNDTLPTGWYITEQGGGARDNEQYAADNGGSTTGDTYSYGTTSGAERAVGGLRSATLIPIFGAIFSNNTGATIQSLDVSYTGEEWRLGTASRADRIDFQMSTDATDLTTGTYTDVDALDFTTPNAATTGAKDGNAAANRTTISFTISGLDIPNGSRFFIRWTDFDASGADDGLAVDDFSLTPNGGTSTNPTGVGAANPNSVTAGFKTLLTVTVAPGTNPPSTALVVTDDLSSIGGSPGQTFLDDGTNGDVTPGDNVFSVGVIVPGSTATGSKTLPATITDAEQRSGRTNISLFVQQVIGPITAIHDIQGSGKTSPLSGKVTTTGIVTGTKNNGFFIQEADSVIGDSPGGDPQTADGDPNTSEGLFIFTSSAPPAAATVGNLVTVKGTISEFIPSADPNSQPLTELGFATVSVDTTGNSLPAPVTLTAAQTTVNDLNNLEKYEGMRVHVDSLTVVAPTQGNVSESNATATTNGVFYGVITGVARPFREPGIQIPDPIPTPTPNPNGIRRFDANPERIRVDSDGQTGAAPLEVTAGATVRDLTGPLDYAFRAYTILPDAAAPPTVSGNISAIPVPTPTSRELTIGTFNTERFYDTVDDPLTEDVVVTTTAFNNRLNKTSLAIRNVMRMPDVIGVEEMENLTTLQVLANKVNNDELVSGHPNPNYVAYLEEGNDIGGIDVGFLVKTSTVSVNNVQQFGKNTTYINPNNGQPELLNDRPPLVLQATIVQPGGDPLFFTVIVNHLRSLSGIDDPADGNRIRTKRRAQAESLADLMQEEFNGSNDNTISIGDYNAFQFNDGFVDTMGTIKGTPAPVDQVVLASSDLVDPDLTDLLDLIPADQRYSFSFDGNAQALDHVLVNSNMLARYSRLAYARNDADFPESFRNDPNRPERISDHDMEVAYFNLAITPTAANGIISGSLTTSNGASVIGAVLNLSGSQSRKTISDAHGKYRFDNVETNGFYTVTPFRVNYTFSPSLRTFSQLSNNTEAIFTAVPATESANPLDTAEYFVRQQYVDLLGREPEEGGFNYWSDRILECGSDALCVNVRRRDVAAAFFIEAEFQQTGLFIYDLYKGALGRRPAFSEYLSDRQLVVGGADLEVEKAAFAQAFVGRAEFMQKYQLNISAASFVNPLLQNVEQASGIDLGSQREALSASYNTGASLNESRSLVLRELTESIAFRQAEYNPAFVLTEYFGYLRRDPEPEAYNF